MSGSSSNSVELIIVFLNSDGSLFEVVTKPNAEIQLNSEGTAVHIPSNQYKGKPIVEGPKAKSLSDRVKVIYYTLG